MYVCRYEEFAGSVHAYSTHLPLFYFSKEVNSADAGAINSHHADNAKRQRTAWGEWQATWGGRQLQALVSGMRRVLRTYVLGHEVGTGTS